MSDVEAHAALLAKVKELEAENAKERKEREKAVKNWENAKAEVQAKVTEYESRIASMQEEWEIDKVVAKHGIDDPEAVEYVKYKAANAKGEDGNRVPFASFWEQYSASKPAILSKWLDPKPDAKPASKPTKEEKVEAPAKTEEGAGKQFSRPQQAAQQPSRPAPVKPSAEAPTAADLARMAPADRRAHLVSMGLLSEKKQSE